MIFVNEKIGNQLKIPYNCNFLTVEFVNENEYLVKEIYYVKSSGPFSADFGVRSDKSGLIVNKNFHNDRKNMRGATLIRGDNTGIVSKQQILINKL